MSTRNEVTADYSLSYGLPGKDGYTYDRPFDYFHFEFTAVTSKNGFENLMTRGLLFGKKYEAGDNYRGVWGLYGSFDYISPQVFRVSSTALSLGTTGQWWLTRAVALQGSALGGIGYGAAGNVHPSEERDYHYGAAGQALLGARLIFGDKAMFDLTAREYYISGFGSTQTDGSERIFRGNASFTVSVYKAPRARDPVRHVAPGCVLSQYPRKSPGRLEPGASPTTSSATPGSAPSSGGLPRSRLANADDTENEWNHGDDPLPPNRPWTGRVASPPRASMHRGG